MKWKIVASLAMAAALSSCAADPTWERILPPSRVMIAGNGCPKYTVDDATPLSQWKTVGTFWDQDACQGTPFQVAEIKGRYQLSREEVRKKAKAGDPDSIKTSACWDQKGYMSWTAPDSDSLIGHEWDALPYACVEKDDPRLKAGKSVASPQVAGN